MARTPRAGRLVRRVGRRNRRRGLRVRAGRRTGGGTRGARSSLRYFRQATILAVAITALLILLFTGESADPVGAQQPDQLPDTVSIIQDIPVTDLQVPPDDTVNDEAIRPDTLFRAARDEAVRTAQGLWYAFLTNLPAFIVSALVLLLAWAVVRGVRAAVRRGLRGWERANATSALVGIAVWLFAIGVVVSVIAGDIRALVGSLGLVGLALSWALQTPIESFTGWLLNSFQGYYRVGDRVAVGEVFGDVYRIDFLTTTVWEIGSLDRPGFVQAEQPTGRLITFPNNEVLAGSIVNLTRDFPYVWDELTLPVGNRSDLAYASEVLRKVAAERVEPQMRDPAATYETILRGAGLESHVAREAQVFVSLEDSWTNLTVRYLVPVRERRRWKSELAEAAMTEFNSSEHQDRIISVFPRRQIQVIGPDGKPADIWSASDGRRGREAGTHD
jgi:small-conductance mechanosensitive channel